ncbi:CD225/dispanin family protein [Cellulomonas sp. ICMP 17802]|uniref:CD225/dispanin family protein n=1 Tax=Cellulomonas sp. ICMP 17802 TaxID=3239199 RepID=UPI00351B247A
MATEPVPTAAPAPAAAPVPPVPTGPAGPAAPPPRPPEPSAPVGWVIAAMILFWPTGIPALLASHRAARAFGAADTPVAFREAANARRWGIISVIVGGSLIALAVLASIAWLVIAAFVVSTGIDDGQWQQGPNRSHVLPFDRPDMPGMPDRQGSGN